MKNLLTILLFISVINNIYTQIDKVHPPNWWIGFENQNLQLLIKEQNISDYEVSIDYPGIKIIDIHEANSPNYIFIDLNISSMTKEGDVKIIFSKNNQKLTYNYSLKKRRTIRNQNKGFDSSDVVYLITPDRYANGNIDNDIVDGLKESKINRSDGYARHGGDLKGIIDNLSYIEDMGFTSIWLNPVLINDMKEGSYHGYATTDYYTVDPRFGTLDEYIELSKKASKKNIKIIKDIIVNHCGLYHWWMDDLPFENWLNYQEVYLNSNEETIGKNTVYSNHRRSTIQDIYASELDYKGMLEGWFVPTMPDLNQKNQFMANYLIQNSIWWIETLNLAGIRQDTYPYADKGFLSDWAGRIMNEYPKFNIVGEEWSYNPIRIAYWQKDNKNKDGYESNLKSVMDFAMQKAIFEGINEEENWNTGLIKIYENLANDFHYNDPNSLLIFNDNHDMSRIFTQMKENVNQTKMAMSIMLVLPRIPQVLYGTEILMQDSANPGDHGLIRTDFPGGWNDDNQNAFTGENLSEEQLDMQNYLKVLLNFRKNNSAIHKGRTMHYAPSNGIYLLARMNNHEKVLIIINKNKKDIKIDTDRFYELGLKGKELTNIHSGEKYLWSNRITIPKYTSIILTTD